MSLSPGLRISQQQRLRLTPALRQSLNLLRLPASAIEKIVAAELQTNPFLQRVASAGSGGARADTWLPGPDTLVAHPSLIEHLHRQIGLLPLAPKVRAMAEFLAGELRDDGYFDGSTQEIAAELGLSPDLVEAGIEALQRCDPAGIGARNLAECLALQLMDRIELDRETALAAVALLDDFAAGNLRRAARALGMDDSTVRQIAEILPRLSAKPVHESDSTAAVLRPDLEVRRNPDGAITVTLTRAAAPRLRINPAMLSDAAGTELAATLKARGEDLINALAYRGETLLRIGQHLAQVQAPVFAEPKAPILPLSRRQVAAALGLHPSTVGRLIASKSIDLHGHVRPLSDFFSTPLPVGDGRQVSAHAVRQRIAALIADEPPGKPLSDAAICALLRSEGVDIARRTVAKYRQWMRLPAASGRRRIARNRRTRSLQAGIPKD